MFVDCWAALFRNQLSLLKCVQINHPKTLHLAYGLNWIIGSVDLVLQSGVVLRKGCFGIQLQLTQFKSLFQHLGCDHAQVIGITSCFRLWNEVKDTFCVIFFILKAK